MTLGGRDIIEAKGGRDQICAGSGADEVDSGTGSDTVRAGKGEDMVEGGQALDLILGGADDDEIFGDSAGDKLLGSFGDDTIHGGPGDDGMSGDPGPISSLATGACSETDFEAVTAVMPSMAVTARTTWQGNAETMCFQATPGTTSSTATMETIRSPAGARTITATAMSPNPTRRTTTTCGSSVPRRSAPCRAEGTLRVGPLVARHQIGALDEKRLPALHGKQLARITAQPPPSPA